MNVFHKFALQSLKKNRTRTIVTIIGIILSVAMLTAVTTTISSIQKFLLDVTIQNSGSWHAAMYDISGKQAEKISSSKQVRDSARLKNVCYVKLEGGRNKERPYLYVGAYEGKFDEMLSFHMQEGRLPQNENEIILPTDLRENGGLKYKVGDSISLTKGIRKNEVGELLWQRDMVYEEEDETFVESGKTAYRVVGIYESAFIDSSSARGYTAITKPAPSMADQGERIYVTLKDAGEIEDFTKKLDIQKAKNLQAVPEIDTNRMYLIYSGNPTGAALRTIGGLMAILIGIIVFGSVALIGNSFSISVNERKKQYGLLSSIGATRKQLKRNVLYEASILSIIGIPLGVLAGIGGMSITFYFVSDLLKGFLNQGSQSMAIQLQMSAALWAVLMAAAIGFFTILISAYLPARKALKTSAIEVIRQSQDVRIRPRQVRTSRLTGKLFGLEGILASKNFKRNRKKYRATVFSLFISVVLFISATSFCDYMSKSLESLIATYSCDLRYGEDTTKDSLSLYHKLQNTKGITKAGYYLEAGAGAGTEYMPSVLVPDESVGKIFRNNQLSVPMDEEGNEMKSDTQMLDNVYILFVEDTMYKEYLEEQHLDPAVYMNGKASKAVVYDKMIGRNEDNKIIHYPVFEKMPSEITLCYEKKLKDGYENNMERKVGTDGKLRYRISKIEETETTVHGDGSSETEMEEVQGSVQWVSAEELYEQRTTSIGAVVDDVPFGADSYKGYGLMLFYPESARKGLCPDSAQIYMVMSYNSSNPSESYKKMSEILESNGRSTGSLFNVDEDVQSGRALMLVLRIFSYGFICLISLIAIANVFNTISTNILLRRREFAMLRSVGMTDKGFRRMMNLECILYGCKGLFFGLIVAAGVTYLIYQALSNQLEFTFYIPWYSVMIAVGSVFIVVFATMLYAMSKIKKDNVVETLKQESY